MKRFVIDCSGIETPEEFWQRYLAVVKPRLAGFGCNLDAFNDALAGGPGYPGACELELLNSSSLAPLKDGQFLSELREIVQDSRNWAVTVVFR